MTIKKVNKLLYLQSLHYVKKFCGTEHSQLVSCIQKFKNLLFCNNGDNKREREPKNLCELKDGKNLIFHAISVEEVNTKCGMKETHWWLLHVRPLNFLEILNLKLFCFENCKCALKTFPSLYFAKKSKLEM